MRYLLDTNIISELVRPEPHAGVQARFEAHAPEAAIASIVWHELWFGVQRLDPGRRRSLLAHYLETVIAPSLPVLAYNARASRWHANERARLTAQGRPVPLADGMIAAIAATHDLVLVTRNSQDFSDYAGLRLENWFAP